MAAQVQSKSNLLPQQMMQLLPKMSPPLGKSKEPTSQSLAVDQTGTETTCPPNAPVTSQELSVAQMMMTLAQASSQKNTMGQDGNSTGQTPNIQHTPNSNGK